jgi:dienelactone hydrolase
LSETFLSKMSGPCCYSGVLHDATPVGVEGRLHGLDCYISEPASGVAKGIVVILTDVFGWRLPNTRALADQYAKRASVKVLVPDFFAGMD